MERKPAVRAGPVSLALESVGEVHGLDRLAAVVVSQHRVLHRDLDVADVRVQPLKQDVAGLLLAAEDRVRREQRLAQQLIAIPAWGGDWGEVRRSQIVPLAAKVASRCLPGR